MASDTNIAKDPTAFPYSDDELKKIGVLDKGAPKLAKTALDLMKKQPNKWALQCVAALGIDKAPVSPTSPTLSESTFLAFTVGSSATVVSEHAPTDYERLCYYNGIAGEGECPELLYRSDYLTRPFHGPTDKYAKPVVKSVYGADDTALGKLWPTVLDPIRDIVKAAVSYYSALDAARFYTHGPNGFVHNLDGKTDGGSLGPAVVWVGVPPGSASPDTAHNVSQTILKLLNKNGVDDAVVEWRDAVVSRLSGPALIQRSTLQSVVEKKYPQANFFRTSW